MESQQVPANLSRKILIVAGGLYSVLLVIASWKHVLWRDEAQAWLISRDSQSLTAVVHNVRYEGTPPLWHFVLYFITRFTLNPQWMKVPNCLFSIAASALILSAHKVPIWARIGFIFSYFIFFEYAVIDRDYMIGIMLLVAALTLLKHDRSDVAISIVLTLAAFTSAPALVVAVCLYATHLLSTLSTADLRNPTRWAAALGLKRTLALIFFAVCTLVSYAIIRPEGGSASLLTHSPSVASRIFKFSSVAEAYLPIPSRLHFWNTSFFAYLGRPTSTTVGILLAGCLCFWFQRRVARYFFIVTSTLLMVEMALAKMFAMRHIGWLFIVFLLAVILESEAAPPQSSPNAPARWNWRPAFLAGILVVQAATGLFAIVASLRYPFSPSKQVVDFLQQQHLDHDPLVFLPDFSGSAILAYLQRPYAYSIERGVRSSFILWDAVEGQPHYLPSKQQLDAAAENGISPVLITEGFLSDQQASSLGVKFIGAFYGGLNLSDHYCVYR